MKKKALMFVVSAVVGVFLGMVSSGAGARPLTCREYCDQYSGCEKSQYPAHCFSMCYKQCGFSN